MNNRFLVCVILILSLILVCGYSNQAGTSEPQVTTSHVQINEDGTQTEIEKIEVPEGELTADELLAKEEEISKLLEEQGYIKEALVHLLYSEGETEKVYFFVALKGDALEEHIDEISALVVNELDSCDLENSLIADIKNGTVYTTS